MISGESKGWTILIIVSFFGALNIISVFFHKNNVNDDFSLWNLFDPPPFNRWSYMRRIVSGMLLLLVAVIIYIFEKTNIW